MYIIPANEMLITTLLNQESWVGQDSSMYSEHFCNQSGSVRIKQSNVHECDAMLPN